MTRDVFFLETDVFLLDREGGFTDGFRTTLDFDLLFFDGMCVCNRTRQDCFFFTQLCGFFGRCAGIMNSSLVRHDADVKEGVVCVCCCLHVLQCMIECMCHRWNEWRGYFFRYMLPLV